jgi:hypothetical protein
VKIPLMPARRHSTRCVDCRAETVSTRPGVPTEYYRVRNELWKAAGMDEYGGCLCIGCLEIRIGRRLQAADFADVEINNLAICNVERFAWSWRSDRLIDRLSARAPSGS